MYLIQDVQILMNSWMIHALKLENLNQNHVNNISHSHRVRLCGMAIKYSESAVSLLILLPGVLLGIVMIVRKMFVT